MYQQIIHIGEDAIKVCADYSLDDDTYVVVNKLTVIGGGEIPVGALDLTQIESIASRLEIGHDNAVRELNALHRADMLAERDAFREAYA